MVRTWLAIKLPVVGRARCATGLNARRQMGQPHAFRIPPWAQCSDRRMESRIAMHSLRNQFVPEVTPHDFPVGG
jgi:hypothetical protein